ncbi:lipase family protein [Parashewanella spongiae]|uniref:Lipase family protein n=1 Tax=Parashewanella spongiae TaxID=342950 RepID=A0A3A6TJQ2_9GAMM|nr:lipase family protein [Parashewanella spongiae]MCL1080089.1 lipase family protein [Parashewanella spongiae]RJY05095.1 lipase family protein [Parashewanella spongiae]
MTSLAISPLKTSLDAGNAYWMALLAQAVYTSKSDDNPIPDEVEILVQLQAHDPNFEAVYGFNKNNAQAILVVHEYYLCMSFRGSDEKTDWLSNLNIFHKKVLFGEFHKGFWNTFNDIWKPLEQKYLQLKKSKPRPLFLTGHSLGGAMATIAAAKFIHTDSPFTSVYTFGQPRAMTRNTSRIFNDECKTRFFRFHNNNDIVTRIPTRSMGYSHVGTYLYISQEQEIHQELGFWMRFLDALDGILSAIKESGIDAFEDHKMNSYFEAISIWNFKE